MTRTKEAQHGTGSKGYPVLILRELEQSLTKHSSILVMTARNCCLELSQKIFDQDIIAWVLNRDRKIWKNLTSRRNVFFAQSSRPLHHPTAQQISDILESVLRGS